MTKDASRVTGWWLFAGIVLGVASILNIIYGIGAIDNSTFFVNDSKFILGDLNTWGWVTLIIGVIQGIAAFSLWSGGGFGRWIGIFAAAASAIAALLSIDAYPFWSLAVFALAIIVLYQLARPSSGQGAY
jgi:hypothetical protein